MKFSSRTMKLSFFPHHFRLDSGRPTQDDEVRSLPMPPWYKPIRISRGVLERNIKTAIPDLNREIVVVCAGGMRSVKACESMQVMGYTKVHSLKEGIGALTKGFHVAK